jgi:hypothetical protein
MSLICIESARLTLQGISKGNDTAILIEIALPVPNTSQKHPKHITDIISDVTIGSKPQNTIF